MRICFKMVLFPALSPVPSSNNFILLSFCTRWASCSLVISSSRLRSCWDILPFVELRLAPKEFEIDVCMGEETLCVSGGTFALLVVQPICTIISYVMSQSVR